MRLKAFAVCLALAAFGAAGYLWRRGAERPVLFSEGELAVIRSLSPLGGPPPDPTNAAADNPQAARLGRTLFFDARLSANGAVSCATCHNPRLGWSNGDAVAQGVGPTARHAATLWNTAYNRWFFWDGRADSQWSQALRPLEAPNEHGGSRLQFAHYVASAPEYRAMYEAVFGRLPDLSDASRFPREGRPVPSDPAHPHQRAWASMAAGDQDAVNLIFANLGKAIAAFERRIVSAGSPFDTFVEGLRENDHGKTEALSPAARRGLKLFVGRANCVLCHSGPNFTDGEFHNIRLGQRKDQEPDPGRYAGVDDLLKDPFNSSGRYSDFPAEKKTRFLAVQSHDWGRFKTPTLRNVAETAPYMHDGRFATLEAVLHFYSTLEGASPPGHHEESVLVPLHLTEAETADLLAFLRSLSGTPPGQL